MNFERYFDHAATTPVDPRVVAEILPFLSDDYGNAHSIHGFGLRAMQAVDQARYRIAELIQAEDPAQIYFTSGATEANNWVLSHFASAGGWASPFEHSSVREPAIHHGFEILENTSYRLELPKSEVVGSAGPKLVSVMAVNNEVGSLLDGILSELSPDQQTHVRVHSDITQAVGKIEANIDGLDYASFSAHKLYGPKGVGALYCRDHVPDPLLRGGGQEFGYRAGTLNVPAIVGFGVAAKIASDELAADFSHAVALKQTFLEALGPCSGWMLNGGTHASPYIVSVSFLDVEGETLVIEMDRQGFAISSGSACSSHSTEPSHVLRALGLSEDWSRGTVRISFGRSNTCESTVHLAQSLVQTVEKIRTIA